MEFTEEERARSLKYLTRDAILSAMAFSMTSAFLSAFALALGAGSLFIGFLASVPLVFWTAMQMPAARIVRRSGKRKRIALLSLTLSRLLWVFIIPLNSS